MNGDARDSLVYEVDHLATFTVGPQAGVQWPEDGMRKLRIMETSTGIWTMRCQLLVDRRELVVVDKQTGEEVERFFWSQITDPTAIISNDRKELYNNIVLFTVSEDPRRHGAPAEMHIFQALARPAREVIEDIKAATVGRIAGPPPAPQHPGYQQNHQHSHRPPPPQPEPVDYVREQHHFNRKFDCDCHGNSCGHGASDATRFGSPYVPYQKPGFVREYTAPRPAPVHTPLPASRRPALPASAGCSCCPGGYSQAPPSMPMGYGCPGGCMQPRPVLYG